MLWNVLSLPPILLRLSLTGVILLVWLSSFAEAKHLTGKTADPWLRSE